LTGGGGGIVACQKFRRQRDAKFDLALAGYGIATKLTQDIEDATETTLLFQRLSASLLSVSRDRFF